MSSLKNWCSNIPLPTQVQAQAATARLLRVSTVHNLSEEYAGPHIWSADHAVSWSSLQKSVSNHTPGGGHRLIKPEPSATSNIYDLPFTHSAREVIHYTPISQSIHSPCSTRVSRISSLPSSPALTPRNTRHLAQRKVNLQFVTFSTRTCDHRIQDILQFMTEYQNLLSKDTG